MKRIVSTILALCMTISLTACTPKEITPAQDNSPITMFIPLGNNEKYYTAIAENIENELGYDVEFVYQISGDTTNMTRLYFKNNDLPADIIFTASKTDDSILKDTCIDLLSNSSLTSLFTQTTIQECATEDGSIYQLPISSKLIGITYNETLMNEMGWSVPKTFDDMVDLKKKCDETGIKFAVTGGAATGHGFNMLFHLMGSQWLSTPEGTEWFESYQKGETTVDLFKEKCEYFKRWTEAGLFGSFHDQDWNDSTEFSTTRALFWYSIINSAEGYEGPLLDENGNETGVTVNDTYKTIPWISENGSNNCYTYYNSCWVYVNKNLEAPQCTEKLKKVLDIIELLTKDESTQIITDSSKDTYIPLNSYKISDDRLYSNYTEDITNGFIQPWYYNDFDVDSIVFTGEVINSYIDGKATFDEIFTTLDECNQANLKKEKSILADFPDGLNYEDTAKLLAISGAKAFQKTLDDNGKDATVEVTLAPYTQDANQLQPWIAASVSNSFIYPGEFDSSFIKTIIPPDCFNIVGIYMTGAEIKAITEKGFDISDRYIDSETGKTKFDLEKYGTYPYICLVKDNAELVDTQEYLVALCDKCITLEEYNSFSNSGKIISDLENAYTYSDGIEMFAEENPTIKSENLIW